MKPKPFAPGGGEGRKRKSPFPVPKKRPSRRTSNPYAKKMADWMKAGKVGPRPSIPKTTRPK